MLSREMQMRFPRHGASLPQDWMLHVDRFPLLLSLYADLDGEWTGAHCLGFVVARNWISAADKLQ